MARYFVDTDDGCTFVPGDPEDGFDCPRKAKAIADQVLGSMTEDALPNGEQRVLRAVVRHEDGREIYVATVTFAGEWKVPLAA